MRAQAVVLGRSVTGAPTPDDFRLVTEDLGPPGEGQALVRVLCVSADPGTRSRLSAGASYAAPLAPGDVIDGFGVAEVIESRHPKFAPGDLLALGCGWRTHALIDGRGYVQKIPHRRLPLSAWIGVLGVPGMTAWFGLTRVAGLKPGDRVLATSAAGPVGATAGQIAKRLGAARVAGVAGGPDKCGWVRDVASFDACVDYRHEAGFETALDEALPDGVDVLFDNVGGALLDRLIPRMRRGGRIVISGQIADYNAAPEDLPGLKNTRWFIAQRLRMEGIVVFDDLKSFADAQNRVADMILSEGLAYREETAHGIEALPEAFCGLFDGAGFGRRIVRFAPDPEGA